MEWELAILFSAVMNNAVNIQVDITDILAMVIFKIVGIGLMVVHELVKDILYNT